jgi:serine/threonine protein kinase
MSQIKTGRSESYRVEIHPEYVKKFYNQKWKDWNKSHKRKGEYYFLTKYTSPLFVSVLDYDGETITLENCGEPLEPENREIPFTENKDIDLFELVKWLYDLRSELKRFKIIHRDINPTNILYKKETQKFKLIDFNWAEELREPSGIVPPPQLNTALDKPRGIEGPSYYIEDDKSINKMMTLAIQKMIGDIASEGYKDGSSVNRGWFYHPSPFEEFSEIPVHKTTAIDEYKEIVFNSSIIDLKGSNILDIGSSQGYFAFKLAEIAKSIIGIEGDIFTYRVTEAIRLLKDIRNISFLNYYLDENTIPNENFDITIFLNTHMWIYKQIGPIRTQHLMRKLSEKTKNMFFQTSGIDGNAMFNISEFKTSDDIGKYLLASGFKNIKLIRTSHKHGGNRHLFYAEGSNYINTLGKF